MKLPMTGLVDWVNNNSCCSEGQATCVVIWLHPLQLSAEWPCFPDNGTNPGILKILYALQLTTYRKRLSQLPSITLPQRQVMNDEAVAMNTMVAHLLCPFPHFLTTSLSCNLKHWAHSGNTYNSRAMPGSLQWSLHPHKQSINLISPQETPLNRSTEIN